MMLLVSFVFEDISWLHFSASENAIILAVRRLVPPRLASWPPPRAAI